MPVLKIRSPTYSMPSTPILGFMYVDPKHRGKGVNKKIIEALQAWAEAGT